MPEELKKGKYNDNEDLVFGIQQTYDETIDILDLNYNPTKRRGFSKNPGIYDISDMKKTLDYIFPDIVKVSFTIDDIRTKSNLYYNQTLIFT